MSLGRFNFKTGRLAFLPPASTVLINTPMGDGSSGSLNTITTADLDARGITTANVPQTGDSYGLLGTLFAGMTCLPKWLRGLFRKDAMDATAKSEINASGGTFDETTDSLEAIRDTEHVTIWTS